MTESKFTSATRQESDGTWTALIFRNDKVAEEKFGFETQEDAKWFNAFAIGDHVAYDVPDSERI